MAASIVSSYTVRTGRGISGTLSRAVLAVDAILGAFLDFRDSVLAIQASLLTLVTGRLRFIALDLLLSTAYTRLGLGESGGA